MWRQATAIGVAAAVLVGAGSAGAQRRASGVVTVARWHGALAGLTQEHGHAVWCSDVGGTQVLHTATRMYRASSKGQIWCLGPPHESWAAADGTIAWGGYEEVRCSDTHWTIYVPTARLPRTVDTAAHSCVGYGRTFVGLASDGASILYATASYGGDEVACDIDDRCRFRVVGGGVYRISRGHGVRIPGLGPSGVFAAGAGLVALAEPFAGGPYSIRNGTVPSLPAAKPNGLVAVRRTSDASVVCRVRPGGQVTALAVTSSYLVAVVGAAIHVYDVHTGAAQGSLQGVPRDTTVSASGKRLVYTAGTSLHLVDLRTRHDTVLWRGSSAPLWPTIDGSTVVWGVQSGSTARILRVSV